MKRYLHFYYWLVAVVIMIYSTATVSAQTKVTSLDQLKAGSFIKIYPKGSDGTSHYGESNFALACRGNGKILTSSFRAGRGSVWTLVDAGGGYYYLKNNLGCYFSNDCALYDTNWSIVCTTDINAAVKVSLTWNSTYAGVCFWNQQDGMGLNNLYDSKTFYTWDSSPTDYASDANTTFDVALVNDEGIVDEGEDMVRLTSIDQLKSGMVVNIYPDKGYAPYDPIACKGDGLPLVPRGSDMVGADWTIIRQPGGGFYLENELGCRWDLGSKGTVFYQGANVGMRFKAGNVIFSQGNYVLSNAFDSSHTFKWTLPLDSKGYEFVMYEKKPNQINYKQVTENGIRYLLYKDTKIAMVKPGYEGDMIVPQYIYSDGEQYQVCAFASTCFEKCTSVVAPYFRGNLEEGPFLNSIVKSVEFGDVSTVGAGAFADNASLTSVTFGNVEHLEGAVFTNCKNLVSVTFGKIKDVSLYAFTNTNFENVRVDYSNASYKLVLNCYFSCGGLIPLKYLINRYTKETTLFPNGYCGETNVFPCEDEGVKYKISSFTDGCFDNCTRVTIDMDHGKIRRNSFGYGNQIELLYITGLDSLEDQALKNCQNLQTLQFYGDIKYIGDQAVCNCPKLGSVGVNGNVHKIGDHAFCGNPELRTISFNDVDSIGAHSFDGLDALEDIKFKNVNYIGFGAFMDNPKLWRVEFGDVGCIDEKVFSHNFQEKHSSMENSITFGNVGSMGSGAFSFNPALNVAEFGNVSKVSGALYDCFKYAHPRNDYYQNRVIFADVDSIIGGFFNCDSLETVSFGNVKYVGNHSFRYDTNLKSVKFDNVQRIDGSFNNCNSLTKVDLGNVEYIDESFWENKIEKFIIPASLKSFGVYSLPDDVMIKCYVEDPKDLCPDQRLISDKNVYVIDSLVSAYRKTYPWDHADIYPLSKLLVKSITLDKKEVDLTLREGILLTASVLPKTAEYKTVKWSSSNENVATVHESGFVSPRSEGEAIIRAEAIDGSGVYAECLVRVSSRVTDVDAVEADAIKVSCSGRKLHVTGCSDDVAMTVTSVAGAIVYQGFSHEVELNAPGIYVVKAKGKIVKICIK